MNATEAEVDTKLAACPFCGSEATLHVAVPDSCGPVVECVNPECGVAQNGGNFLTNDEAIAAWNRRPALSTLQVQTSEAVAWRFDDLLNPSREPLFTHKPYVASVWQNAHGKVTPLYASPPASQADLRKALPDDLRALGYAVAVHNDYRISGDTATFWLLTHPNGTWLKGEGATDAIALNQIRRSLSSERREGP